MLFSYFKKRRRRKQREAGLPDEMLELAQAGVWQFEYLTPGQQEKLLGDTAVFFAEKYWEGCGGHEMTDESRAVIAAQMAMVTLGLDREYFDSVLSVLVYPDAYVAQEKFTRAGGLVIERESTRLGEAWHRGPVILSWSDVVEAAEGPNEGRHIVAHEFSHQLDMLNGGNADGVPPMASKAQADRWLAVTRRAFRELRRGCRTRNDPMLDCYGASEPSEFFAVASEAFFQTPQHIAWRDHELYEVLRDYYRVDPLKWA